MNDQDSLPPNAVILVTGATGFVGAYVVRDLILAGYRVKAMRRKKLLPFFVDSEILRRAEWIEGDIMDIPAIDEALQGTDAIVHAAAMVSFKHSEAEEMFRINIEGTANMVNLAIEHGIKKFIHVSSVSAIGREKNDILVNESGKWSGKFRQTRYGVSKQRAEMEVWRGIAEGLNAVIINPATILGYGDWNQSSSAIFKSIYRGFPWYTTHVNGFVGIEDVSRVIVELLSADVTAERFIVSAENKTYESIFNAISDAFGKKRPWRRATPFLAALAWRLEFIRSMIQGSPRMITRETSTLALSDSAYDNKKLLSVLPGFKFSPIDEIITRACNQYSSKVQRL